MLDDENVIKQRDPHGALAVAANEWQQVRYLAQILEGDHDNRPLTKVVVAGMGGSALAAGIVKTWLDAQLNVPFEVLRDYNLPQYVDSQTLVIVMSYSGNTEEELSILGQAHERSAQIAIVAAGGQLATLAKEQSIAHVLLPGGVPQRMAMFYMLRALVALLAHFGIIAASVSDEIAATAEWLERETQQWLPDVTTATNEAKQLALLAVGKTPVFYGGPLTAPVAFKWKISWNENAKNVAFWNQYSEFNHNEFMGWVSHPIEKPFAIFDLISSHEHPQILRRFELSDKLLSGLRPKAHPIWLRGDSLLQQMLWGCILADFASIYVAILNGIDPVPVELIEKLKKELAQT